MRIEEINGRCPLVFVKTKSGKEKEIGTGMTNCIYWDNDDRVFLKWGKTDIELDEAKEDIRKYCNDNSW